MNLEELRKEKDRLWQQVFALQRQACEAPLCLLDKLQFNDLSDQLKQLSRLEAEKEGSNE